MLLPSNVKSLLKIWQLQNMAKSQLAVWKIISLYVYGQYGWKKIGSALKKEGNIFPGLKMIVCYIYISGAKEVLWKIGNI